MVEADEGSFVSADGVPIAYSSRGVGDLALVLIHGGFADRSFWAAQLEGLADRYRVVSLDLAGHGSSGGTRTRWTLQAFARDVKAVVEGLGLKGVVLVGNSLGGPVALEAAPLLVGPVIAVVAVDTLHEIGARPDPEHWKARVEAFRRDFPGTCHRLAGEMFHPDADPELMQRVMQRLSAFSPDVAVAMLSELGGYDTAAAVRAANVPVRAINGDLFPTDGNGNREHAKDYEAVVLPHSGHYPMVERPLEFNRVLVQTVESLAFHPASPRP